MNWNASYLYLYLHLNGTFYVDTCLYWNNSWKCFRCNSSASSFVKCVFVRSAVAVFFVLYKSNPAKASKAFEEKGGPEVAIQTLLSLLPNSCTFQTFLIQIQLRVFRWLWKCNWILLRFCIMPKRRDATGMFAKVTFHALRSLPFFMAFLKYF